jgi:beta-lactamase superfamily II metal-dependent hydrolase
VRRAKGEASRVVPAGALIRFLSALILAFLLLCVPGCGLFAPRTTQPPPAGSLGVSFIDVGQSDAVLVQSGGKNYLIHADRPVEVTGVFGRPLEASAPRSVKTEGKS